MKQPKTLNYAGLKGKMGGGGDSAAVGDVRLFRTVSAPFDTVDTTKYLARNTQFLKSAYPELAKVKHIIEGKQRADPINADTHTGNPIAYHGGFADGSGNLYSVDNVYQIKRQLAGDGAWTVVRTPADINADSPAGTADHAFALINVTWHNGYFYRFCLLTYTNPSTSVATYYPRVYRCATVDGTWVKVLDGYSGSATGAAHPFVSNGSRLVMPCGDYRTPTIAAMRYSNDNGATWSLGTGTGINNHPWQKVLWTGTEFVAFSYDYYTAKSTDGIAWTVSAMTGAIKPYIHNAVNKLNNTAYCNGYFWGCDNGGGNFVYSTDGIAWTLGFNGGANTSNYVFMYPTVNGLHILATYSSGAKGWYWYVPYGRPADWFNVGSATTPWQDVSVLWVVKYGDYLRVLTYGVARTARIDDFVDSFYIPTYQPPSPYTAHVRAKP